VTVRRADGSLLHGEPRLLRVGLRDGCGPLEACRLRELIRVLAHPGSELLWSRFESDTRALLDVVTAREAARLARLRRREEAVARTMFNPSVARQLVQAGLFDRRALRAAALDATAAASRQCELSERAAATPPALARTELIAALLVPRRR